MEQQQPSKFHSAIELNRHSGTCNLDSSTLLPASNAFIGGVGKFKAKDKRDNHNISSCDSMNLETIGHLSYNRKGARTKHQDQTPAANYTQCPQQGHPGTTMRLPGKAKKKPDTKRRPNFRIDWRQLSYYQRPESLLDRCLSTLNVFSPSNSKTIDKQMKAAQLDERSELSSLVTSSTPVSDTTNGPEEGPRKILDSLDGCFRSGELSAILGPSGAGKSTFLSALFGSKQENAVGFTKVTWLNDSATATAGDNSNLVARANKNNSEDLEEPRRSLRIASLPQHDHLLHHLTVYETLMFASRIKNHARLEGQAKEQQEHQTNFHHMNVKRVAKMLKLTECLNTRCGKLSGGQYKRVSIGQELLSEPDVIILDEPTSGLDAMTCLTTIQTLKSIVTKHPMSIILTIHQPDSDVFNLFDKIYVIAQGGLAIYEGPPDGIMATLAQVNLIPPRDNYNPARFIVENAFIPELGAQDHLQLSQVTDESLDDEAATAISSSLALSSSEDEDEDPAECNGLSKGRASYFKRSVQSLTDTIMGKETPFVRSSPFSNARDTIRRPLLNIGIRTLDGQLITSEQLAGLKQRDAFSLQQQERIELLRRLNRIQKARYERQHQPQTSSMNEGDATTSLSTRSTQTPDNDPPSGHTSPNTISSASPNCGSAETTRQDRQSSSCDSTQLAKSDCSSASMNSLAGRQQKADSTTVAPADRSKSISLACLPDKVPSGCTATGSGVSPGARKPAKVSNSLAAGLLHIDTSTAAAAATTTTATTAATKTVELMTKPNEFVVDFGLHLTGERQEGELSSPPSARKMRRRFDKRLSSKHNCANRTGYPILYHALVLTHRTWLSIVRDPVFFGIQASMHTLIPIVLATIFGSVQEEGCPRIGKFDLVDFAYSDSDNLIQGTVRSIRQSIGNIGIVFFEMFVICFAINCITALVFPLDMFVLLKEYRNGWYSLRSYFLGRTLADLPVPVVLHSIGMAILYFMTGQPHSLWRFTLIVLLVILASLVAQSVGLTIGALLMKSSQSAVLAAAAIVAPFFALSGFIVRIHTLPMVAQLAANASYLYHLLNGFIILRYGFGRCKCSEEDFEENLAHQIPANLHTMASMWIGTYSDEYANSSSVLLATSRHPNRSNVDPNIDVVDKMMSAFKTANSYGHHINDCNDVLPYAMLDFNQRDQDIYYCFYALVIMVLVTRSITFSAIYYKIRSFA